MTAVLTPSITSSHIRYNNAKKEHETSTAANNCEDQACQQKDKSGRMNEARFFFSPGHSAASRNVWHQHQVTDGIRQVIAWIDSGSLGH